MSLTNYLSKFKIIFWDFDGVIKESVEVKTKAFQKLFQFSGKEVVEKVTEHHLNNGGMSRLQKIPIYLTYAGVEISPATELLYCNKFGKLVEDTVVNADWVPGAEEIIKQKKNLAQLQILVSATPQDEIERILNRISIFPYFSNIFGAPMSKSEAIITCLDIHRIPPKETIMIGDSKADYEASQNCGTNFILRRTPENVSLMNDYSGDSINNFLHNGQ